MNLIEVTGHVEDKRTRRRMQFKGLWMTIGEMRRYFLEGGLVVTDYEVKEGKKNEEG